MSNAGHKFWYKTVKTNFRVKHWKSWEEILVTVIVRVYMLVSQSHRFLDTGRRRGRIIVSTVYFLSLKIYKTFIATDLL